MSEATTIDTTLQLVKEAQAQGSFNLSEVIKGRGYPHKSVTIYTDAEAAFDLIQVESQLALLVPESPEHAAAEALATELATRVRDSRLVFHMRGVGQLVVEAAEADAEKNYPTENGERSDNWYKRYMANLVAANIVKVEDANGNLDERIFTAEDVEDFRNFLPIDSWAMLMSTMQQLTLATGYFKGMTNADFLPKS